MDDTRLITMVVNKAWMIKAAAPNKTNLNTNECPQQRSEFKKEQTSGISCGNEIDIYELFIPTEHQINVPNVSA